MDYFLVMPDPDVGNALPLSPDEAQTGDVVQMRSLSGDARLLDIYQAPCWLFSERFQKLLLLYQPELPWTLHALADPETGRQALYFRMEPPALPCVSGRSSFTLSKRLKKLVLLREAVREHAIFTPAGILERRLIVSLPLAESILRRGFYGLTFERITEYEGDSGWK